MIEVEMVDDIRKTDTKAIGPLTYRQAICIVLAASYSIPLAIALPIDIVFKVFIGFFSAFPVAACGWIKLNNEPFEIVLIRYVYKHFLTPMRRKCKPENPYKKALLKVRKQNEQARIKAMPAKKRKQYEKKMKKGKFVTYSKKKAYKIYR